MIFHIYKKKNEENCLIQRGANTWLMIIGQASDWYILVINTQLSMGLWYNSEQIKVTDTESYSRAEGLLVWIQLDV